MNRIDSSIDQVLRTILRISPQPSPARDSGEVEGLATGTVQPSLSANEEEEELPEDPRDFPNPWDYR